MGTRRKMSFNISELENALKSIGFNTSGGGNNLCLMRRRDCSIKIFAPYDLESGYTSDFQFVVSYDNIPEEYQE